MEWELNFQDDNILVVKCNGDFCDDDLRTLVEQFVSDQRWKPDMNIIIDFTGLVIDKINLDDIYSSLDIHREYSNLHSGKLAVINKDYSGFGISSLYENISKGYIKSKYASFIRYADAIDWIREENIT